MCQPTICQHPTQRGNKGNCSGLFEFSLMRSDSMQKEELKKYFLYLLDILSPTERWALIKLVTGGLRVGVSSKLAKTSLAEYGNVDRDEIEKIWHGLNIPYLNLWQWLDGKKTKPKIEHNKTFNPMMLAHPIDEDKDMKKIN